MNRFQRQILLIVLFVFYGTWSFAQNISLKDCYEAAEELSPVSRQQRYYESIARLKIENAKKLNLPSTNLEGRATYQSDVFTLPFADPNLETPDIPKDQYQLSLGLNQTIYDGGLSRLNRNLAEAENSVNQQQVIVDLYQTREIINRLFFGGLIAQENEKILDSLKVLLQQQLREVESRVSNGVILASNVNILKKEILNTEQQLIRVQSDKQTFLEMLGEWIGREVPASTLLITPAPGTSLNTTLPVNRPEMKLFDLQSRQINASRLLMAKSNYPRLSAFADGGVGSPNPYNVFETDVSGYFLAGIKLQWKIFDWGANRNDLKVLDFQKEIVTSEKNDFERQINISLQEEIAEIRKLEALIEIDRELLSLQEEIVREAFSQLRNGVITSTEYITEVNNETRARINIKIHELDLIKTKVSLLTKSGNL